MRLVTYALTGGAELRLTRAFDTRTGAGACPAGAVTERVGRRVTDTQLEDEESGSKGRGGGGAAGGATLSAAVGHMGRLGMRRSVSFSDEHGRPLMEVFEIESLRRYTREGLSRKQLTLTLALAAGLITGFMIVMAAVVVASRR